MPASHVSLLSRERRPKVWKILTTLFISTIIGLALVEVMIRLLDFDVPRVWEPDPVLGWRHIPGAVRHFTEEGDGLIEVNSLGQRDRERSITKPAGTFRIMAIGDSMTEADQVNLDQTYGQVLERHLNRANERVEVLNFGVNGYAPLQYLLVLRQLGPRYKPDLVTIGLFLDNDVSGSHPSLSTVSEQSPFVTFERESPVIDFSRAESSYRSYFSEPIYTIRKCSATYRWLRAMHTRRIQTDPSMIPTRHMLYAEPCPAIWDEAWQTLEKTVLEISAEAERQGAKLLVVMLPCAHVVDRQSWANIQRSFPAMKELKWDLERPERRFKEFAEEHKLLVYQLLDVFRENAKHQKLFLGDVGHMNANGHQLTGNLVAQYIRDHDLLPKLP